MTKARFRLVDASVSCLYHCISRCCRKAHLLSDVNGFQRKNWIDQRLKELNEIFSISVGGFSTHGQPPALAAAYRLQQSLHLLRFFHR